MLVGPTSGAFLRKEKDEASPPNRFGRLVEFTSIPRLRRLEVFYFRLRTGLSTKTRPRRLARAKLKDQSLKKIRLSVVAGLLAWSLSSVRAVTISENFVADPLQNGWKTFGNSNLFVWNATNRNLEVTWDSRSTNSFFYQPLGTIVTREDDYSIEFDLRLADIQSGIEPFKTGPLQIALGFVKFSVVSDSNFGRGIYGGAPNLAEFNYYTDGYYDFGGIWPSPAATVPSFISGVDSFAYCPSYIAPYDNVLPTNQVLHVTLSFTAANQTATLSITSNGVPVGSLPALVLNEANGFKTTDNFYVDTFSISSYSSFGDDYDSVLAHGTIGNLIITVPPPPVQNLAGNFQGGQWQCTFTSRTNWLYALERSTNLVNWTAVISDSPGVDGTKFLSDTNSTTAQAFYRIRAERP